MANTQQDILIVDDTPANLTVLRQMLTENGYRVRPAISGEIALSAIQADTPDLILLDVMMPGMDGFTVCRKLKADPQTADIPVLFISALNELEDKVKGFQVGAVDFITKPFHDAEVLARVKTHLELRDMQKTIQEKNLQLSDEVEERKRAETALSNANRKLELLASQDGLTEVSNRRQFDQCLQTEWSRMIREQAPIAVILCDIDCFKLYNDAHGHVAGDKCLQQVAAAIRSAVKRPTDLVARYGGEEFAVIMPNTDTSGAAKVAQEIGEAIENLAIPHGHSRAARHITLSMGVDSIVPNRADTPEGFINAVDQLLYKAKKEGRNRIAKNETSQALGQNRGHRRS